MLSSGCFFAEFRFALQRVKTIAHTAHSAEETTVCSASHERRSYTAIWLKLLEDTFYYVVQRRIRRRYRRLLHLNIFKSKFIQADPFEQNANNIFCFGGGLPRKHATIENSVALRGYNVFFCATLNDCWCDGHFESWTDLICNSRGSFFELIKNCIAVLGIIEKLF